MELGTDLDFEPGDGAMTHAELKHLLTYKGKMSVVFRRLWGAKGEWVPSRALRREGHLATSTAYYNFLRNYGVCVEVKVSADQVVFVRLVQGRTALPTLPVPNGVRARGAARRNPLRRDVRAADPSRRLVYYKQISNKPITRRLVAFMRQRYPGEVSLSVLIARFQGSVVGWFYSLMHGGYNFKFDYREEWVCLPNGCKERHTWWRLVQDDPSYVSA